MRFLVDLCLSPRLAVRLTEMGHDAVHGLDLGLVNATDEAVLEHARAEDRVLVSADSDFGTILAATGASKPSVILIKRTEGRRVEDLVQLFTDDLDVLAAALDTGSVVVVGAGVARIRELPIL